MSDYERIFVKWTLLYMVIYVPFFFAAPHILPERYLFSVIMPFHIVGMFQNFFALYLTIRDLYNRPFQNPNDKLTWLLLILLTGGIGWIVYIFKHALNPIPLESDATIPK